MKKYTNFSYGFNMKGKRTFDVGEDVVGTFNAPADMATPTYSGTPLDIDSANPDYVKVTADGEKPEFLLYSRVDDQLTDIEMYEDIVARDEVRPDEPVTILPLKPNAMIETKLFADGYTPTAGDELYIAGGKFQATDPTGDSSGVVVGVIKKVDADGEYATVLLK